MDDKPTHDDAAVVTTDTPSTIGRVIIEPMPEHLEDCYEIEPITGGIIRKARPGAPKITSEDVRRWLEEADQEYDEQKMGIGNEVSTRYQHTARLG
ncbi:MAG TPA: hypothetical protein VGM84_27670 [Steroidobacteraceae bacterium]|jgi:hypothetical protein